MTGATGSWRVSAIFGREVWSYLLRVGNLLLQDEMWAGMLFNWHLLQVELFPYLFKVFVKNHFQFFLQICCYFYIGTSFSSTVQIFWEFVSFITHDNNKHNCLCESYTLYVSIPGRWGNGGRGKTCNIYMYDFFKQAYCTLAMCKDQTKEILCFPNFGCGSPFRPRHAVIM